MKIFDDFFPELRLDVTEAALPIARQALQEATRKFCRRTQVWQETKTLSLQANQEKYLVPVPENARLQDIIYFSRKTEGTSDPVEYSDLTIYKATQPDLDYESRGWRNRTSDKAVVSFWGILPDQEHLFITPIPTIMYADGIRFTTVIYPGQNAVEVPDLLYEEYSEDIAAGAAARILSIPGKPWTDLDAAKFRQSQFNRAINVAWNKTHSTRPRTKFRRLGS